MKSHQKVRKELDSVGVMNNTIVWLSKWLEGNWNHLHGPGTHRQGLEWVQHNFKGKELDLRGRSVKIRYGGWSRGQSLIEQSLSVSSGNVLVNHVSGAIGSKSFREGGR